MSGRYKLGLSRNRLFEFNNTVVFCGKYKSFIDENEANKALKMLAIKEPVVTSVIELEENSDAYVVTDVVEIKLNTSTLTAEEMFYKYQKQPLDFTERLFEFSVSSDGFLVIAGHTVVCDAKSLLRLAVYFTGFYEKSDLSVEPSEIHTFSVQGTLPVDVVSPMINKLSAELDGKWEKDAVLYSVDDFKKAKKKYVENFPDIDKVNVFLTCGDVAKLKESCNLLEIDFSSILYFCFYSAILKNVRASKDCSKMRIYADRRFFHGEKDVFSVGAYNGMVCASLKKKDLRKPVEDKLKAFHLEVYRAVTSPYRVFADEVLLSSLSSAFCDSSYIYMAGESKLKSSKILAENYGCMKKELCDCLYCNLTQRYWNKLTAFEEISVNEPFRLHSDLALTIIETPKGCKMELRYNKSKLSGDVVQAILSQAESLLDDFKK